MVKKPWKLWLDDLRPAPPGFVWAKSSNEASGYTILLGPPEFMSLDHDLGGEDTTMVFLKSIVNMHPDSVPEYQVHSANPVGKKNIEAFLESWRKSLELP